jgi:competence protein ComEC
MEKRKIYYGIVLVLLFASLIMSGMIFSSREKKLKVIFLDVGQGDAILISQGSRQILVDGGIDSKVILEKLGKHVPFWDRQIEIVMATHPDQDHIGGLLGVMKNYEIGRVIDSPAKSESQIFKNYEKQIEEKNIARITGGKGLKIKMDEANLEIVYPHGSEIVSSKDTNAQSLVAKLSFGENSFLLTGDLPSENEKDIMEKNFNLSSRVLKVAHHGSKHSTSQEFLEKFNFQEAVISVGASNRYGHPAPEVIKRLQEKGMKILRTDEKGDISYNCEKKEKPCYVSFF